jgi:hypothetical protein
MIAILLFAFAVGVLVGAALVTAWYARLVHQLQQDDIHD